jgi:hypothetical protein
MMDAASTLQTAVGLYETTWCSSPRDGRVCAFRRKNLKSYKIVCFFCDIQTLNCSEEGE